MMGAPTSLRAQQQALAHAIVGEATGGGAWLQPRADGSPALIDVYRHAHAARLVCALRDNFEVLARAMGDDAFEALARAYLQAHPPTQPSIRWFGDRLADHMARADEALVPHPALVDLARMDWALRAAFDAADAGVLDVAALRPIDPADWPALRLRFHPSVVLLRLQWAVESSWRALDAQDGSTGAEPDLPAPQARPHALLVWRRELATQWRSLDDDEAELLEAALVGERFGALCERAAARSGSADAAISRMAGLMQVWLIEGLVSACPS